MRIFDMLGWGMLVVGVILIIYAFLTGLTLYGSLNSNLAYFAIGAPISTTGNFASINGTLTSVSNIAPQIKFIAQDDAALFAQVLLLFLFSIVGFEFAYLGVRLLDRRDKGR